MIKLSKITAKVKEKTIPFIFVSYFFYSCFKGCTFGFSILYNVETEPLRAKVTICCSGIHTSTRWTLETHSHWQGTDHQQADSLLEYSQWPTHRTITVSCTVRHLQVSLLPTVTETSQHSSESVILWPIVSVTCGSFPCCCRYVACE
jgi:hypothetical protein